MSILIQQTSKSISHSESKIASVPGRFINWCAKQEENRFGWLAAAITIHGCALTPVTILAVSLAGNNFILFMLSIVAMAATLITNLAAMPTKITIPVFFLSICIDLVIVINSIAIGMSMENLNTF